MLELQWTFALGHGVAVRPIEDRVVEFTAQ